MESEARHQPYRNNTSGKTGVYWHVKQQRWTSVLIWQGVRHWLGSYGTREAAAAAYDSARLDLATMEGDECD